MNEVINQDELKKDIKNTEMELMGYQKVAEGYRLLAGLSDAPPIRHSLWESMAKTFDDTVDSCEKVLNKLRALLRMVEK